MEIILHAGQHKTGTTSVQAYLRANRDALGEAGLFIPASGMNGAGSHRPLIAQLAGMEQPRGPTFDWNAGLARELATAPQDRALISAELAKLVIVQGKGDKLIDGLRAAGAERVHIVVYLRSPFALVNASYSQRTSALINAGLTFDQYIDVMGNSPYFKYGAFLDIQRRQDVELTVRPYNAAARGDVIGDLLGLLGVDHRGEADLRLNSSFGPMYLEAVREFTEENGLFPLNLRNLLRQRFSTFLPAWPEAPFWAIEPALEARLADFDTHTETFAQAVWGAPWRDVIGDERRPLNVFDPALADETARALYAGLRAEIMAGGAAVLEQQGASASGRRGEAALRPVS